MEVFTDGSCDNKTGIGGLGYVFVENDSKVHFGSLGTFYGTTSARMEIMAVLEALYASVKVNDTCVPLKVWSDNQYVVNTWNKGWVWNWQRVNWHGRKNADLWREFLSVVDNLPFEFSIGWIRGHNGHEFNEIADYLAGEGRLNGKFSFKDC